MAKKLYEVTIEHLLFVMAEDEQDAEDVALRNMREGEPSVVVRTVRHPWPVDQAWQSSYPWGDDLDKTVGQRVAEMGAAVPRKEP